MRLSTMAFVASLTIGPVAAANHEPCGESAVLYIDTPSLVLMPIDETVTMYFSSTYHAAMPMTFAGGIAPADLISAVNAFTEIHGLIASNESHSASIQVKSIVSGNHAYATVAQAGCAAPPLLMNEPDGERLHFLTAGGSNAALGDLDCDGVIGVADLLLLLDHWGPCPYPHAPCPSDLTLDGKVDVADLLTLLERWGAP